MLIDERKAEYLGILLTCVGLFLTFFGIDGPLIAGAILCGSILIARQIKGKGMCGVPKSEEDSDSEASKM